MFQSQIDHHQGDTIFVFTSVTKFNFIDAAACLQVTIGNEFSRN
jgi:hypothetical protein